MHAWYSPMHAWYSPWPWLTLTLPRPTRTLCSACAQWCIVSSPLILAFNLSEPARHNLVWDIITNKEAIQINQVGGGGERALPTVHPSKRRCFAVDL